MAVKKTETVQETETVVEQENAYDPWTDMRDVMLPRETGSRSLYFSVNDYTCQIPRGQRVQVPYPIALAVEEYLNNEVLRDEAITEMPNRG